MADVFANRLSQKKSRRRYTEADLEKSDYKKLQKIAKTEGVSASGKRGILIQRITQAIERENVSSTEGVSSPDDTFEFQSLERFHSTTKSSGKSRSSKSNRQTINKSLGNVKHQNGYPQAQETSESEYESARSFVSSASKSVKKQNRSKRPVLQTIADTSASNDEMFSDCESVTSQTTYTVENDVDVIPTNFSECVTTQIQSADESARVKKKRKLSATTGLDDTLQDPAGSSAGGSRRYVEFCSPADSSRKRRSQNRFVQFKAESVPSFKIDHVSSNGSSADEEFSPASKKARDAFCAKLQRVVLPVSDSVSQMNTPPPPGSVRVPKPMNKSERKKQSIERRVQKLNTNVASNMQKKEDIKSYQERKQSRQNKLLLSSKSNVGRHGASVKDRLTNTDARRALIPGPSHELKTGSSNLPPRGPAKKRVSIGKLVNRRVSMGKPKVSVPSVAKRPNIVIGRNTKNTDRSMPTRQEVSRPGQKVQKKAQAPIPDDGPAKRNTLNSRPRFTATVGGKPREYQWEQLGSKLSKESRAKPEARPVMARRTGVLERIKARTESTSTVASVSRFNSTSQSSSSALPLGSAKIRFAYDPKASIAASRTNTPHRKPVSKVREDLKNQGSRNATLGSSRRRVEERQRQASARHIESNKKRHF